MSKSLKAYSLVVIAAAGALAGVLDWSAILFLPPGDLAGLSTFVVLALVSHALAVDSTLGKTRPVKSSTAFLPLLASAVLFPTAAVVIAVAIVIFVTDQNRKLKGPLQIGFNIAQTVLGYGVGALFHRQLLAFLLQFGPAGLNTFAAEFIAFYGLVAVFFLFNVSLVSLYLSIREQQPYVPTMMEAVGRGGGNLVYAFLASPVALAAVYLYREFAIGGIVAVIFPILLIRYSYSSAIGLQKANRDLLRVLIKAIETRDPYTSGHSVRVSSLARHIAEDFGLRASVIARIETAALLHDIGKIDVLYAELISKTSSLTSEERAVIQTHAVKGADLLASLTSLERDIIVGVRHHHERYDGNGYPDGLVGKAIPLAARIIMLCDSIDAMLSDRPYRLALPLADVKAELRRCAGSQFDPDLVESILTHNTLERAELLIDRADARSTKPRMIAGAG